MSLSKVSKEKNRFWEEAYVYLIYLYSVFLPLRFSFKNVALFLLIGTFIYQAIKNKSFPTSIFRKHSYKAILTYLAFCVFSLLYTQNQKDTLQFLILQSSIFVLPILFYKQLSAKQIQNALLLFSFSCFLLTLYASVLTGRQYMAEMPANSQTFSTFDWVFVSYNLPQNIKFHAPYYSLYIGVCLLIHSCFLYNKRYSEHKASYFLHLILWLFFFVFLTLLSSRTALISTLSVILLVIAYLTIKSRRYLLLLSVVLVTAGASILIYQKVTYLKIKLKESAGVSQRKMMWLSALDIIQENPVLGIGTGDNKEALTESYKKNNFIEGTQERFDAHNQYIALGISMGIPGFLVFMLILFLLLKEGYTQKNFILFSFVAVFALCCLTESLLQRRDGVLLYSFIVSLLLFSRNELQSTPFSNSRKAEEIPS